MLVYVLTDQQMKNSNGLQWDLGEPKEIAGGGPLCLYGWLNAYESPLLAVLHNPIYESIQNPRLFVAETLDGKIIRNGQMRLGSSKMVLVREMDVPKVTVTQRVAYGILCAMESDGGEEFMSWATRWLAGEDRSRSAAAVAAWEAKEELAQAARAAEEAAKSQEAQAAAAAAWAAEGVGPEVDLVLIAERAMEY